MENVSAEQVSLSQQIKHAYADQAQLFIFKIVINVILTYVRTAQIQTTVKFAKIICKSKIMVLHVDALMILQKIQITNVFVQKKDTNQILIMNNVLNAISKIACFAQMMTTALIAIQPLLE